MIQVRLDTNISRKQHICTVSVSVDDFIFHDIQVKYGRKGLYLIFPTWSHQPINEQARKKVLNAIIEKLKQYPEFMRLHGDKIEKTRNIELYTKDKVL